MEVFSVDDIVWAKSSVAKEIFWPAKIVESDSDIETDKRFSKKPVVAFVNFLAEDTYETIRNVSRLQPFDCERKADFIKKGRRLKNQLKRLEFESAIKLAEQSLKSSENQKMKSPANKSPLDTKKQKVSPLIRDSYLLRTKNDSKIAAKCSLETILEESSHNTTDNTSARPKSVIDKVRGKITKKRSGISKAKAKVASKKTDHLKHIRKAKRSYRKSKLKTEELGCGIGLNEGHLKSPCVNSGHTESVLEMSCGKEVKGMKDCKKRKNKRETLKTSLVGCANETTKRTRLNSLNEASTSRTSEINVTKRARNSYSESGTKGTRGKHCVTNELSVGEKSMSLGEECDVNEAGHSQTTSFKTSIKVPWGRKSKNASSRKTKASESSVKSCSKASRTRSKDKIKSLHKNGFELNTLESIPEEHESEKDETTLTSRRRRFKKRRHEIENNKLLGKSAKELRQENKRLRLASFEEATQDNRIVKAKQPVSDDNLGFETQVDKSGSLSGTNNEDTKTEEVSSKTKQPSKAADTCLEGLNGLEGSSCGNTDSEDKQRNLGSERLQSAKEGFGDEGKENKVENVAGKGDSAGVNETQVEAEDNLNDDASSDDESLPEAFSLSPDAKKCFLPGDIVWIKHTKFPFWPGQIAYQKRKSDYYYIKFLPKSDCKWSGMKIHKKNIKSFTRDHETNEQFKRQEMEPGLRKDFEESVKQAEDILVRRVFKKEDYLLDEIEDQASEFSDDDDEQPLSSDVKQDKPVNEVDKQADEPDEEQEDGESGFDSSETDNHELSGNGRSPRQRKPLSRYSNILNELHQCKQRLLDIYRGKVYSSRHTTYNYGTATERNHLQRMPSFGPIQDDETCEEIIRLLKTWYDEEQKTSSITFSYVFNVWLPEAMIHYIQITDNLSAEDAEQLYLDHTRHVDKRDVRETTALLKNETIEYATMQETVERAKRTFNIISS